MNGVAAESQAEREKQKSHFRREEGRTAGAFEKTGTERQDFCLHFPCFLRNPLIAQIAILL